MGDLPGLPAWEKCEAAKQKWEDFDRKPQKTSADKNEAAKARREVDHWARKARESGETHSREPKGGKR